MNVFIIFIQRSHAASVDAVSCGVEPESRQAHGVARSLQVAGVVAWRSSPPALSSSPSPPPIAPGVELPLPQIEKRHATAMALRTAQDGTLPCPALVGGGGGH